MRRSSSSSFQQVLHIEHGCALRSSSGARGLEVSAKSESGWRQQRYVDEQVRWRRQEELLQQIGLGLKVSFFFHHQTSGRLITRMVLMLKNGSTASSYMHSLSQQALLPSYLLRAALAPNFAVHCLLTATVSLLPLAPSTGVSKTSTSHILAAMSGDLFHICPDSFSWNWQAMQFPLSWTSSCGRSSQRRQRASLH